MGPGAMVAKQEKLPGLVHSNAACDSFAFRLRRDVENRLDGSAIASSTVVLRDLVTGKWPWR